MPPRCYHKDVSEPSFSQEQPRSLLVPALLAVVFVVLAFFIARHFFAATTVNIAHLHTDILPTATVFKADTIVVGPAATDHTLFVASTIRIENQRQYPISLDDFTITLTDIAGAQTTAKAIQKLDLPNTEVMFPNLKPLVGPLLLRDTNIDPGKSAQGTVVFSLPVDAIAWNNRKSAEIQVDIYHGHSVYTTIPKS
jgi:hypothetical protein